MAQPVNTRTFLEHIHSELVSSLEHLDQALSGEDRNGLTLPQSVQEDSGRRFVGTINSVLEEIDDYKKGFAKEVPEDAVSERDDLD